MSDVWLVVSKGPAGFSKLLALKQLKRELCGDPDFVEMFLAEARLSARLSHPNLVQTYEVLEGRRPGIVMEWLEGQPLHVLLGPSSPASARAQVPLAAQVFVLAKVLEGLEYAHELRDFDGTPLGLVHRDVSPHNVFVGYDGSVKLMDFGIAKLASSETRTQAGIVKGKVGYVAPEQIAGVPIDRRADLFAVGVMLWEALVGRRLSAGEPRHEVFSKRVRGEHPRVLSLVPDAPRSLAAVVDRAMACSPDQRYPSAAALRADLDAWLVGQRMGERDVAALMAAGFAEERRHVRKLVEQQMRVLQDERPSVSGGFPVLSLVQASEAGAGGDRDSRPSHEPSPAPTLLTMGPPPEVSSGALPAPRAMLRGAAPPAGRPARWWLAAFTAVTAVLSAFALVPGLRKSATSPATSPVAGAPVLAAATSMPPVASAAPAEPVQREVELLVRTQPAGARVFLDGEPLGQSPITHRATRDAGAHVLRVSSPGFRDEERALTFARDYAVELSLKPQPSRPGRPAPKAPAAEPEPEPERIKQLTRGARPIEESNPY